MSKDAMIAKMIDYYDGNVEDVNHFLKVYAFASVIGAMEGLDEETRDTLETAAIVHDIACPLCREKYGDTDGHHQEQESEPLLRAFLKEFHLPSQTMERVVFLITHHHTYTGVDGSDYRILLEADYLVNAGESEKYARALEQFRENVFRTATGLRFLNSLYGRRPCAAGKENGSQ